MADEEARSPLQRAIAAALAEAPRARDHYDKELQRRLGTKGKPIYDIERGKSRNPSAALLAEIAGVLGVPATRFIGHGSASSAPSSLEELAAEHGLAFLEEIDLPLGMGATYLDGEKPEVLGLVPFRLDWLRGIYDGAIEHLKVVRGTGDSMKPTIEDGDVVVVNIGHRRIDDQDRIWAVAYGELGMIRRIRVTPRGTWLLMPDNQVVRPDEVGDGEAWVLGRVIWIGRRI